MRINWITYGPAQRRVDGSITSRVASLRYRVLMPIRELSDGYAHRLIPILPTTQPPPWDQALDADLLVFSKSFRPANAELARRAKAAGVRVIFDVCDNHYDHPRHGAHYREMSALADQVVCNSPEMAKVAGPHCAAPPVVIEDPFEGPRGEPRYAPGERLKLLWFGHPSNLDSIPQAVEELIAYAARRPLSMTLLTDSNAALEAGCERANTLFGPGFEMRLTPWSLDRQWQEIAACDAVVIPLSAAAGKQVKSANRMVEGLWGGRPVVAQPMPAYQPFAAWTPVRPTLAEGLEALEAAADSPDLIRAAQDYIETHHAPAVLARRWRQVLQSTTSSQATTP
jgi:hypothetical protein